MVSGWDVIALVGLASMATGLWMIWPPVSLIVVGLVLMVFALWAEVSGGRSR